MEQHPITKGSVKFYSFVVDWCQEISPYQSKFTRVFLLNPKGFFDIGKEAKPGTLFQTALKLIIAPHIAKAIGKSIQIREKKGFKDELKLLQTLQDNKQTGMSD